MAQGQRQLVDPLEVVDDDQEWYEPLRRAVRGLEDADGLECRDVLGAREELAESTARIDPDERPKQLRRSSERDTPLGFVADDRKGDFGRRSPGQPQPAAWSCPSRVRRRRGARRGVDRR